MYGTSPPISNNSIKSCSCPWTSPHIVTGAITGWVLVYEEKISIDLSHRNLTCDMAIGLNYLSVFIMESKSLGPVAGAIVAIIFNFQTYIIKNWSYWK